MTGPSPTAKRVLVVRGHQANPWDLAVWSRLSGRFDVGWLRTSSNVYDVDAVGVDDVRARALRDRLPRGLPGDLLARAVGDRYTGRAAGRELASAAIVHAAELSYWFSADVARRRLAGAPFRLVNTVWETLPLGAAYRNRHARRWRTDVIAATDLFLAATERARAGLVLEGVQPERIEVVPPAIDVERFAVAPAVRQDGGEHVVLSVGRLEWQKGHHDLLRAVAALRRGLVDGPVPRVVIVGRGPERERLVEHAADLGIADRVDIRPFVPYEEMPTVYAQASCFVLASLPSAGMGLHPFDVPRAFWEEQFGMVLAESMAAGLDVVATTSGAIPEVLAGHGTLVAPGDPLGLARALVAGPLSRAPGTRVAVPDGLLARYSLDAGARRLEQAYERVLAMPSRA